YVDKYGREKDSCNVVYDAIEDDTLIKRINEMAFYKLVSDINEINKFKQLSTKGYLRYIDNLFGKHNSEVHEEETGIKTLGEYLDSLVGKKLYKDDQELLKEEFKKNGLTARTLGINTLNGNLKDRKLPFII